MTVPKTPLQAPRADSSLGRDILAASNHGPSRLRTRLGTRGLVLIGGAVIAAGLALNWSWLVAVGVAPLLLTVLPCAAMCALGVCMMPKGGNRAAADDPRQNAAMPTKGRADE